VRSVLGQTYANLEVIVVVDGTDQDTVAALEALQEPRLRVVALAKNVGGSEARNIGVREAKGKWIAFLDDDDEWLPEKIEKQVTQALVMQNRNCLIVSQRIIRTANFEFVMPSRMPRVDEPLCEYILESPSHGFQTSTFFCLRSLVLEIPWAMGLRGLQDFDWILRATSGQVANLVVIEEPLAIQWENVQNRISSSLDWSITMNWGRENRELMTAKAYSYFLGRICANRAIQQKAKMSVLWRLFKESVTEGQPTLRSMSFFVGFLIFPYRSRLYFRNYVDKIRVMLSTAQRRSAIR
jgi:glycosyltransferase involved in cell wall biosynthesis